MQDPTTDEKEPDALSFCALTVKGNRINILADPPVVEFEDDGVTVGRVC